MKQRHGRARFTRQEIKKRTARHRYGLWAELLCRWHLRLKGYRILAARARTPLGEIDILAARGDIVAVVEVKARRGRMAAASALGPRQCARLENAARAILARHPRFARCNLRFDLMLVTPWRLPEHIPQAWEGR